MEIVLTEITKLKKGKCCVAGVCREEGNRLYRLSDPYATHASVIDDKWRVGTELTGVFSYENPNEPIHCEDAHWNAYRTRRIAEGNTLREIFESSCVASLRDGLGVTRRGTPVEELRQNAKGRSIVTIRPNSISLYVKEPSREGLNPSVRVDFSVGTVFVESMASVPVTDIRFFLPDGAIDLSSVEVARNHVGAFLTGEEILYLRVGVGRPFDPDGSGEKYWVQVDGLHFFKKSDGKYVRTFQIDESGQMATL